MTRINRKLAVMVLIIFISMGSIPGIFGASIAGVSTVAAATNILSQDGIGYSGSIPENEVVGTTFTGYQTWPNGFTKGSTSFAGGVYDGTNIWMIPYNANELVKVNPSTGEMTGYSNWPAGFTKGSNAFAGGVYDGANIWLIPYSANQIIKVNAITGDMTGYSSWPGGSKGSEQFIGGAFDGTNIWLTPYSGSRLIKVDTTTGEMTSYNSWPSGTSLGSYPFYGSVFDGTSIWLIPNGADQLIKVDPATGDKTGFNNWPSGFTKSADAFWGGVFDGTNIWLIPYNATHLVKINTTTGEMTGYNGWPSGFTKGSGSFAGGVYDGTNIWLVPMSANMLVKVNAATGDMTGFNNWPSGFTKDSSAFLGGVYDGENVWMIPFAADRLMKFGESSDLSGLTLSSGTLSPAFSSASTSYTASVRNEVTSIDVTPTTADSGATVTVNGVAVTSGQTQSTTLNVGNNIVTVIVTSGNGITKTYTVTVTRAASANADLSGLTLSSGTLSPAFNASTTIYMASVRNEVMSIDVTPTTADSGATVTVNGVVVTSGQTQSTTLNVGNNIVTVMVTSGNGITKTYTVTVTRAASANSSTSPSIPNSSTSPSIPNSFISPSTTSFDQYVSSSGYQDILIQLSLATNIFQQVEVGGTALATSAYEINAAGNTVTLNKEYLRTLSPGTYKFVFKFNAGNNATFILTVSDSTPSNTIPDFRDVDAEFWAYNEIQSLVSDGVILGYPNKEFRPNELIRREHMILMITRLGLLTKKRDVIEFTDVPLNYLYYNDIRLAQLAGVIDGSDGKFHPNSPLTRAQAAKIIALLYNFEIGGSKSFEDVSEDSWYFPYVSALATNNIVLGDDGYFNPNNNITRAQFAAILYRSLQIINE
ncbi:cadherin-like beta sandwich domain-containing protein [Psychrobacillus sp. INOP01]|uniref:cadherin-like beta sandwich domain-containing protein n=1 Tax=Psychrobacillus sp. INOP01 TaxID=2829187 RepID=UPI001BAE2562|nr:cadherin-like beta sandwich domain-containing protein [Psychrobacillus sp. INOP01]QUG42773.1 cadherin-like beta sandwich domain-containing protein [Psychrobacillus sp. INOP01]